MNACNIPRSRAQNAPRALQEQPNPYSAEVIEREAAELLYTGAGKRALSKDGTLHVYGWSKALFREIAPGHVMDHQWFHCRHHKRECGTLCAARDLYAYCLDCFDGTMPARSMPLVAILIPRIAEYTGARIKKPQSFHRCVVRDRRAMRAALAAPQERRSEAQSKLLRRYPSTVRVLQSGTRHGLSSDKMHSPSER